MRSSDSQYAAAGTDPPWPPLLNLTVGSIRTILSIHEFTKLAVGVAMGQFRLIFLLKQFVPARRGRRAGIRANWSGAIPGRIGRFREINGGKDDH